MNLSKLTVRAVLTSGFGVLAAMVLLVSALSLRAISHEHDMFSEYVSDTSARAALVESIRGAADDRAIAARNLVLVSDVKDVALEKAAVNTAHAAVTERLAKLKQMLAATSVDPQERQLFERIEAVEKVYAPIALDITALALDNKRDAAISKMNIECRPQLAALIKAVGDYLAYADAEAVKSVQTASADYATNRALLLAACVMALALAVGLAWAIVKRMGRALGAEPGELGAIASRVAMGDLRPVTGASAAPAGSVLASLGDMQASLSRVVGEVRQASDSIATGSSQIATGNADLSQRTEQQASSLQQTAGSMEQMNATVRNNADTARHATELAAAASSAAMKGGEIVSGVVATMQDISQSSKRIVDIIGVIDSIAFQTNILALNAAVEAARAGEQGRGFAVVAGEVRSLAQRSASAAKEIKELIGSSVTKVDAGTRQVGEAGQSMDHIVSQVKRVNGMIAEISAATNEQSLGIGQVGLAVQQLDQVTQQNAALVEESAAAAESLRVQASKLVEAVSVFRFDGDNTHASDGHVEFFQAAEPRAVAAPPTAPRPKAAARTAAAAKPVPAAALASDWAKF